MANFVLQAQGQRFPWEVRRQIALEALRDRPFDYGLLEEFFSMGKHRMWKRDMEELKYLIANSELQIDEALLDHECRRGRAKWKKLHPKVFKYCENIRVVYRVADSLRDNKRKKADRVRNVLQFMRANRARNRARPTPLPQGKARLTPMQKPDDQHCLQVFIRRFHRLKGVTIDFHQPNRLRNSYPLPPPFNPAPYVPIPHSYDQFPHYSEILIAHAKSAHGISETHGGRHLTIEMPHALRDHRRENGHREYLQRLTILLDMGVEGRRNYRANLAVPPNPNFPPPAGRVWLPPVRGHDDRDGTPEFVLMRHWFAIPRPRLPDEGDILNPQVLFPTMSPGGGAWPVHAGGNAPLAGTWRRWRPWLWQGVSYGW